MLLKRSGCDTTEPWFVYNRPFYDRWLVKSTSVINIINDGFVPVNCLSKPWLHTGLETGECKWNEALISFMCSICAFPAITCQNTLYFKENRYRQMWMKHFVLVLCVCVHCPGQSQFIVFSLYYIFIYYVKLMFSWCQLDWIMAVSSPELQVLVQQMKACLLYSSCRIRLANLDQTHYEKC